MKGVFKIKKKQRKKVGARITEYGDEKIILEGDCYKPATAASPFYRGKFESFRVENLSGIHSILCSILCSHFRFHIEHSDWEILQLPSELRQ